MSEHASAEKDAPFECGHASRRSGCGGCDPGAIEYVRDDGGPWVRVAPNPCYRARHADAHPPHTWRNGIEVQYNVRCPGYVIPPTEGGLHPCVGCGLELDADDLSDRCEDCVTSPAQTHEYPAQPEG